LGMKFDLLFSPLKVGELFLRNRIVMPAMLTALALPGGEVSEPMLTYYRERSSGGAGLIIVESTNIETPEGEHFLRQLSIGDDRFLPGLAELARIVHSCGAAAALQLCHQGRYASPEITGTKPLSPSPEPAKDYWPPSPAMKKADIDKTVELFASAASRAKKAGFDAVEIHGAHGYLISQFLSPLTNRRDDEYGVDQPSRSRLLEEVIQAVRQAVGRDFPVLLRLSADEMIEGGITLEDTVFYAQRAELAGIDALHISAGTRLTKVPVSIAPMSFPPGFLAPYAERIRQEVSVPVITVGRINDPLVAESLLAEGKADLVAMGRSLIADPEMPAKAEAGEPERIRKCLACNYCIDSNIQMARPLRCAINARAGRESEFPSRKTDNPKRVWVFGGGPAGMEAARTAQMTGHQVLLYERNRKLGGQLLAASRPPWKKSFHELAMFLERELEREGVEVILGMEAPLPEKCAERPDIVLVATGAYPSIPNDMEGLENMDYVTAEQILCGDREAGHRVAVIGGERTGVEVAAFLAESGKEVTIIRRKEKLAMEMIPSVRKVFLDFLKEKGVKALTGVEYLGFRDGSVAVRHGGEEVLIEADTVVLATGTKAAKDVFQAWSQSGVKTIAVGDCVEPRDLATAIREGFEAGYSL